MPNKIVNVTDVKQANHSNAAYTGYAATKTAWGTSRAALMTLRAAMDTAIATPLNPSGSVELHRLLEAIDRCDAIFYP